MSGSSERALDEKFYAYISTVVALSRLQLPSAQAELVLLRQHRDARVRAKSVKYMARCWRLVPRSIDSRALAPALADSVMFEAVKIGLRDHDRVVREECLRVARNQPDRRWFSELACHLADSSATLRQQASQAMLACATDDEDALAAVFRELTKGVLTAV